MYAWSQLGSHIMELSRKKSASNVIEKCLATGERSEVCKWVDILCAKNDRLAELMKDRFGNYVCFTAFVVQPASSHDIQAQLYNSNSNCFTWLGNICISRLSSSPNISVEGKVIHLPN